MTEHADFVVIHPDGHLVYDTAGPTGLRTALRAQVPDLATQGFGRLRLWFADDFTGPGLVCNPVADRVVTRMGYRHPSGWYGPVALTMEEDAHGDIPPLTSEVILTVNELVDDLADDSNIWAPAVRHAPELLDDLMHMCTTTLEGREVQQYKHTVTRRYLNLDVTGQAWWIAVSEHGQTMARPMDLAEAKAFIEGQDQTD